MLQNTNLTAPNDGVRFFMLHDHTDDGGLGYKGADPGHHSVVAGISDHVFREAGAVVVVYAPDPLLDHGRAAGSGKNRQIAPLGMAAEPHGGCVGSPDIMGVVEGQKLGRM